MRGKERMSGSGKKDAGVSVNWFYLAILLISSLLIIASKQFIPADYPTIALLSKEVGFAGIVAIVLVYTVERVTGERHEKAADSLMKEINQDLFKAIYHRYIPAPVFSEVEKCLLKSNVLRTNYEIDYTLDYIDPSSAIPDPHKDNHLQCDILSSFVMKNAIGEHVGQSIEMHLELPIDRALVDYIGIDGVSIDGEELTSDELKQHTEVTNTHMIFKKNVEIPPECEMAVTMACHTIKRKLDMEVWASRLPSTGLTLRVVAPKTVNIEATANHYEKLKESKQMNGKQTIWRLDHGIFPFQSVIFWWSASE